MKKLILAIFAVALFTTVSAQDFKFGAKVGMNVSDVSGDFLDGNKTLIGFNVGVTGEYFMNDASALSAEILYSQQGAKSKYDGATAKAVLGYINIPILYNYYVIDKLAIKAGIQPGFLLSAKYKVEVDGQSESASIKDGLNTVDFAIPVGVSYDITDNISVDARYNIGVSNIISEGEGSGRNNVFAISAGYKF